MSSKFNATSKLEDCPMELEVGSIVQMIESDVHDLKKGDIGIVTSPSAGTVFKAHWQKAGREITASIFWVKRLK